MNFEERKQKLIFDCYNSNGELKSDFTKRFFIFLQDIIISLMQDNDEFFGQFLLKIEKNIDTSKMKPPSFKMILTAVGDYAYKREDGILIVPVTCLGN